ncbi:HesA/MoeB/ThiF family protein [Novosphingobium sp. SL115]|uniref:HesA/MoeB/ThiF family protein n=1 Tax=Novosphingobium sp. SL115 TaxID=2995150 RepID=UPI002276414A|nr:HesA/MoeB/ThiF family protein [Novosphingobium sp. SL115]MCY1670549.1 HesA/MoeB/ThiF family protein [Novosphingobium sp. SL115]
MTPDRLNRFARHIVLPEVGAVGQAKLAAAHVVLVGMGGVGSPALQYLAGAGVGKLTLIDDDVVEASNLQRQTIYTEADIGTPKAEAAAAWVARFDPLLEVDAHVIRIGQDNAAALIAGADLVLDGCDNFATRLAVSDAAVQTGVAVVSVALGRFQGQVANFAGHRPGHACYRCFVGDAFDAEDCDTCADQGVLGAMVGTMGAFGAMAALRVLLEGVSTLGDPQWGQLHVFDGLKPGLRTMRIAKDPECRGCNNLAQ